MFILSIIASTLLPVTFVASQPTQGEALRINPDNLRGALDWMLAFSKHYEGNKGKYEEYAKRRMDHVGVIYYNDFGGSLAKFLDNSKRFRTALVKGYAEDVIITETIQANMDLIGDFLVIIKDSVEDLKCRITQWEMEYQGDLPAIKIKGKPQLQWFVDHGFDESTLGDASVSSLKNAVDEISGIGKTLEHILEFYSKSIILSPYDRLGLELAWLYRFSTSSEALSMIEKHLKENMVLRDATYKKLIKKLHQLGSSQGPLSVLMKGNVRDGKYPYHCKLLNYAVFEERYTERYLYALASVCRSVLTKLCGLVDLFHRYRGEDLREILSFYHFAVDSSMITDEVLHKLIKALITEDGPLKGISMVLSNYE